MSFLNERTQARNLSVAPEKASRPSVTPPTGGGSGGSVASSDPSQPSDKPDPGPFISGRPFPPENLIQAMIHVESSGNARAVSPVGAQGLMQLMPDTAIEVGVSDPFDPEQNMRGGIEYLTRMRERFDDWETALMAYNWGPGATRRWLNEGADPAKVPTETRNYVAMLLPEVGEVPRRTIIQPDRTKPIADALAGSQVFSIEDFMSDDTPPLSGDNLRIYRDAVRLFGGQPAVFSIDDFADEEQVFSIDDFGSDTPYDEFSFGKWIRGEQEMRHGGFGNSLKRGLNQMFESMAGTVDWGLFLQKEITEKYPWFLPAQPSRLIEGALHPAGEFVSRQLMSFATFETNDSRIEPIGGWDGIKANPLKLIEPDRILNTIGEGGPLMVSIIGSMLAHPIAGLGYSAGIYGGSSWKTMEAWEEETGQTISDEVKILVPMLVGGFNAALQKLGVHQILKAARVEGLKRKIFEIALSVPVEGSVEAAQEINLLLGEYTYRGELPPDAGERIIENFYAGAVLAGGMSTAGATFAQAAHAREGEASLHQFGVKENEFDTISPMFKIEKEGHPLRGMVVDLETLESLGLQPRNYRADLLKMQMQDSFGLSETEASSGIALLKLHAAQLGMSTEELIRKTNLTAQRGDRVSAEELFQQQANMWYSRMARSIQTNDRLVKQGTPEQIRGGLEKMIKRGQFNKEELEWSGVLEWLDGMDAKDVVTSEQIVQFVEANMLQIEEVHRTRQRFTFGADPNSTAHHNVVLPGGRDYFELLLKMPGSDFVANPLHYNQEPGVIAGVRADTRIIDGKRVLFIQEIQSDLHQAGQTEGYKKLSRDERDALREESNELSTLITSRNATEAEISRYREINRTLESESVSMSDAPFKTTWNDLATKRMVRYAAEHGFDAIAIPGSRNTIEQIQWQGQERTDSNMVYEHYAKTVPQAMRKYLKTSGEYVDATRLQERPDVNAIFRTNKEEFGKAIGLQVYDVSPEIRQQVMEVGNPLFQKDLKGDGVRGSFSMDDGKYLIRGFEAADVTTMLHELGHVFRKTMNKDHQTDAIKLWKVENGEWTRAHEEQFVADFERWFRTGETTNKQMVGIFVRFQNWLVEAYAAVIGAGNVEVALGKKKSEFFESLFDRTLPKERGKDLARYWHNFADWFDIESGFAREGYAKTGRAIKTFYSVEEAYADEAKFVMDRMMKAFGRKALDFKKHEYYDQKLRKAALISESESAINELTERAESKGDKADVEMLQAVRILRAYFDRAEQEYIATGGLKQGFPERLIGEIKSMIVKEEGKKNPDEAVLQQLQDELAKAQDVEFVHIPVRAFFKNLFDTNPTRAVNLLRVLNARKRKTVTISDLIKEGFVKESDINLVDILVSYSRKHGRDMALLNVINVAKEEGAAFKKGFVKEQPPRPYVNAPDVAPVLRGYAVHPMVNNWVHEMTKSTDNLSIFRRALSETKMGAFFNPFFLPGYDVVQSIMRGALSPTAPLRSMRNAYRGVRDVVYQTPEYFEAQRGGIRSQTAGSAMRQSLEEMGKVRYGREVEYTHRIFRDIIKRDDGDNIKWAHSFISSAKMPFRAIKSIYNMSFDIAWTLDHTVRQITYRHIKDIEGMSSIEAAQQAALAHGDYSSVPRATRDTLNKIFFTPTFKIAMGKFLWDSVRSVGSLIEGVETMNHKQRAAVMFRAMSIMIGFDIFMREFMDFERDEFGRAYWKTVDTEFGPKELVISWSAPFNLFSKYFHRIERAFGPEVPDTMTRLVSSFNWEVQPVINVLMQMFGSGRDRNGDRIVNVFDSTQEKALKYAKFFVGNIWAMFRSVMGQDLDPAGNETFKNEVGRVQSGIMSLFMFPYERDILPLRVKQQVENLERILMEETGSDRVLRMMTSGASQEEINAEIAKMPARAQRAIKRIDQILEEFGQENYDIRGVERTPAQKPLRIDDFQ